jgi:hypothetical protein
LIEIGFTPMARFATFAPATATGQENSMAEIKAPRKPGRARKGKTLASVPEDMAAATRLEQIRRQIEKSAYYRAEQRGFAPGFELEDWIAAESEVMKREAAP